MHNNVCFNEDLFEKIYEGKSAFIFLHAANIWSTLCVCILLNIMNYNKQKHNH